MVILGIDPGLATTGWGVVVKEASRIVKSKHGCILTPPKMVHAERLHAIHVELQKLINTYKPQIMAVEELFFAKNAKTASKVGEARGAVLLTGALQCIPIREFTPLQIKQAVTSYGRADKQQIQRMVKSLLNLEELPKPDDAADALAVALTCAFSSQQLED